MEQITHGGKAAEQITPTLNAESTAPVANGLPEMDQLVRGPRLLEILWPAGSRPSLRRLRKQQRLATIPFTKLGRNVWFCPRRVLAALTDPPRRKARTERPFTEPRKTL